MIYEVEITETLQRIVEIEADDEDSAYRKAKQMYRDESIVLDDSDYVDTKIDVLGIK